LADKKRFRQFKCRNRRFLGDGGEIIQEFVKSLTAFQIVQQRLKRYAGTPKNRSPTQDVLILDDDVYPLQGSSPLAFIGY
jgi:hypothetical protein